MKHLFKPEVFKGLLGVLVLLLIIKVLWFAVEFLWFPTDGVTHAEKRGGKALYYRVKLTPNEASAPVEHTTVKPVKKAKGDIDDIKLLAIYNASDATVVTIAHKSKTKVLSRGENVDGFVLEGAGNNFATFSKSEKTYKVLLLNAKALGKIVSEVESIEKPKVKKSKVKGTVTDAGDHKIIDRTLFEHYTTNLEDIYKNIGITEVKDGKGIKGFKITFVRKDSPFAKLGVRRDDVIKSINGQEITSYNAAFNVYKNIQNAENLSLVIERGKEEMELEYEIN